jgi:hypothetical protein
MKAPRHDVLGVRAVGSIRSRIGLVSDVRDRPVASILWPSVLAVATVSTTRRGPAAGTVDAC